MIQHLTSMAVHDPTTNIYGIESTLDYVQFVSNIFHMNIFNQPMYPRAQLQILIFEIIEIHLNN